MKIKKFSKIIQGHQITDEEIYNAQSNEGKIPIFTARNKIKGYWNKQIINQEDLPCITYPTKGNSGFAYIQKEIFDANNTATLIIKEEYKNRILLNWLVLKLPSIFLRIQTSKEGVSYLNKEIVEEEEINIPSIKNQEKEIDLINKINNFKEKINFIQNKMKKLTENPLFLENQKGKNIFLNTVLKHISRNDALSEEGIYNRSANIDGSEKITVLSGSFNEKYGIIPVDENIHFIKNRCCVQVITRGNAGKIRFLEKNNYATNTNSMLLILRDDYLKTKNFNEKEQEIFLKFLSIYLNPLFKEYTSSADLAVFPLTKAISEITIPDINNLEQIIKIVQQYEEINMMRTNCEKTLAKLNNIYSKEIVIN